MPIIKSLKHLFVPCLAGIVLSTGCGSGGSSAPAGLQSVSIQFDAKAGITTARCGTALSNLGSTNANAVVKDLRFYISDVSMLTTDGNAVPLTLTQNSWQTGTLGMVDLEDGTGVCDDGTAAMNDTISGEVPAGDYKGIAFTVGVPEALNHIDTVSASTPAVLTNQAMAWSWQSGRKFMKVEVNPTGGATATWFVHLGSTGCTGNPGTNSVTCTNPNRLTYRLPTFNPNTQKITLDIAELFKNNNLLATDGGGPPGCMSGGTDPECTGIFSSLQLNQANGQTINNGASQTVFKVQSK